jgi:hypothetical protein
LRVYVDSLTNLAEVCLLAKEAGIFKRSNGEEIPGYNIEHTEEKGWKKILFDTNLLIDLESLETFGLIYRLLRVTKVGDKFTQKHQLRISGWGRGYHQHNLCHVGDELALLDRMKSFFRGLLEKQEDAYIKYFELATKEELDRGAEREAEEIRKKTLIIKIVP